jgi:hypothetical protein
MPLLRPYDTPFLFGKCRRQECAIESKRDEEELGWWINDKKRSYFDGYGMYDRVVWVGVCTDTLSIRNAEANSGPITHTNAATGGDDRNADAAGFVAHRHARVA